MTSNRVANSTSQIASNYHQQTDSRVPNLAKQLGNERAEQIKSSSNVSGWRVAGYHVLNFLTLGTSGAAGSLCANSQAMGTQKDMNSTKHFGQSHIAATHINKNDNWAQKGLKYAAKGWSSIGHLLLSPARMLQNRFGPDGERMHNGLSNLGAGKFFSRSARTVAKEFRKDLKAELWSAKDNRTGEPRAISARKLLTDGSKGLKAQFYHQARYEFGEENLVFMDWTIKKGLQPPVRALPNVPAPPPPDYPTLSKKEVLDLQENLISNDADLSINVAYEDRGAITGLLAPDNNGLLANYKQRLTQAQQNVQNLGQNLDPTDQNAVQQYNLAKQNLEQIENETFDTQPGPNNGPSENDQVASLICNLIPEMEKNCNDMMLRFSTSLDD